MRRMVTLLLCCLMVLGISVTAYADSTASHIQNYSTITSDGTCEVTLTVSLHIETPQEDLTFPLPKEAENIRRDNGSVKTSKTANATLVHLDNLKDFTGDIMVRFTYTLPQTVSLSYPLNQTGKANEKQQKDLYLNLPLLCGFDHPIEAMKFDVMLPASISTRPTFTSTYHQDSIESLISYSIESNMLTGTISSRLKDNETLSMQLLVTPAMFPSVSTYERTGNPEYVPMGIFAGLALLYWLVFLRCAPLLRVRRTTPPEGITAGEVSTRLHLDGADLTMMVVSWAQLGYLLIHLDDNGRVILHKRMDMGNERSSFENKVFRSLFGKKRVIDGTGYQYALLCRNVALSIPGKKSLIHPGNGNVKIFRALACGTHIFCGILLAMNFTTTRSLQIILSILLVLLAAFSGWFMQAGMYRLHLRWKLPLLVSLGLGVIWILLGVLSGQWIAAVLSVTLQWLTGIMAAYGGRRSELGRANAAMVLGLRHFLRKMTPEEASRLSHNDPDFFYNMLPFAMALGVGKAFSRTFGRKKQEMCPYFVCGIHTRMNAADWARFLHEAIEILDSRQRKLEWEQILSVRR